MSKNNAHRILSAEETFDAIKNSHEQYEDWVNLCLVVDDVGYDQLTVTTEQLKDVLDKILTSGHFQLYGPPGEELCEKFGGNPIPRNVDTQALSKEIVTSGSPVGLLTALVVAPYPDLHTWPWD